MVGCSFFNKEMSCEEILINSYEESSLNALKINLKTCSKIDILYDEMFASTSRETNIEKNLLATISFQESQWDLKEQNLIWVLEV